MTSTTPHPETEPRKHQKAVADPLQVTLAKNIKIARIRLDLSQRDLAEAMGSNQVSISHYENGQVWPKPDRLSALAAALGTTPAKLLEEVA